MFFISITNAALSYNTKKKGRLAKHKIERTAAIHYTVVIKNWYENKCSIIEPYMWSYQLTLAVSMVFLCAIEARLLQKGYGRVGRVSGK